MAAGLGFKDFQTGEVLTAADVDGYLMQGIWVFANATARDAAVTSPQEGNFAFLKDTNVTTYYTGSTWTNLDTTGMVNPMTTTGDTIYSSSGSTPDRLGIGTAGQVLTVNSGATAPEWATPAGASRSFAIFFDQKAVNTAGGTFTSGAWRTRDLQTTQVNTITSCSLSSNQITLPAGTYNISASATAFGVNRNYSRFYNITDSATAIIGTINYSESPVRNNSNIDGVITIAGTKTFELQHYSNNTKAGDGFGTSDGAALDGVQGNLYSVVTIEKVG
jgi:hypothetical protein